MRSIIFVFLIGAICVFGFNMVWADDTRDDGARIYRISSTPQVIMSNYEGNTAGSAIYGFTNSSTGATRGITGNSYSNSGKGVYGIAGSSSGVTYGVYGTSYSPDGSGIYGTNTNPNGYAGYFDGKVNIVGDLYVKGSVTQENLALSATATAKTEYYTGAYPATCAIDGIKGQWDSGEWASNGEHSDTWIKLSWATSQTISKCIFYDRCNKYDNILDAWLLIDQTGDDVAEYSLHLGAFPVGGAEKIINLTTAQGSNVRSMKLNITESVPTSLNVGLSEWECY